MKFHFDDRKWFEHLKRLEEERKFLLTLGIAFSKRKCLTFRRRKFPLLVPISAHPVMPEFQGGIINGGQ